MNAMLLRLVPMIVCRAVGGTSRVHAHRLLGSSSRVAFMSTAPPAAATAALRRTGVRTLLEADESVVGTRVLVKGWVRTVRSQKELSFVELNDGSSLKGVQVVAESTRMAAYEETMRRIGTGAAIAATGTVVRSKGKGQLYEIQATEMEVIGECDDTYPLQKKRHSLEFLRSIAHLRARTNTIGAIARVRSVLAQATHAFFAQEGFVYVQTPLVTASDCEGAGEMFRVSTLPPVAREIPTLEDGSVDYSADFFGKPAFLTVSGQLAAETYACALGSVYTFGARAVPRARKRDVRRVERGEGESGEGERGDRGGGRDAARARGSRSGTLRGNGRRRGHGWSQSGPGGRCGEAPGGQHQALGCTRDAPARWPSGPEAAGRARALSARAFPSQRTDGHALLPRAHTPRPPAPSSLPRRPHLPRGELANQPPPRRVPHDRAGDRIR
jgi:hypothetical protein